MKVKKGDVIYLFRETYDCYSNGHIQFNPRPLLVVSNDTGNHFSNVCIVCPLTKGEKRLDLPTHARIHSTDSTVLCEQLFSVNQTDIHRVIEHLSEEEMEGVNNCLKISLAI